MADEGIRQRSNKTSSEEVSKASKTPSKTEATNTTKAISVLDVIRILATIVVATLALSYYTTSGESYIFGYKPWFLNPAKVEAWYQGPRQFTPKQLAKYDGSNPDLPIYIAVNGTIYDVTPGRRMYGPGGSYNVFAGRDASRAFVTGCFRDHKTHDMRDAEEVYLPIEDAPDEDITPAEKKNRAEKERREAKKRAHDDLKRWVDFFANSPKYQTVGKVVGLKEPTGPPPRLCDNMERGRPKRSAQIAHRAAQGKQ